MHTMRQIANGSAQLSALRIAEAALAALAASGKVHISENVSRVASALRERNHENTTHARALACALCAACAHVEVAHVGAPVDAARTWCHTEGVIEAWFADCDTDLDTALTRIT